MRARASVRRGRATESGVAIVSVLLVITLATLIVSNLFWREHVTVRSVENRLALAQMRWIETAVLDWASVVLRVDKTSTGAVDHLTELWATPIAETVLDETVTGGARITEEGSNARLAGQMFDAQARFNLNNLVLDGQPSAVHREVFERLLAIVGRPESLAGVLQV
ncbi:MAG: general secretion pathway protein GspK, partial [Burkholderiales bacterium]